MRLSVIIPVYNSEKTLRAALSSLKRQRYGDFEVLCVNDGSTDGSAELIDAFVQADDRFRRIDQKHTGAWAARNAGLRAAKGEFVTFLDADDILPEDSFFHMHQVVTVYDCDLVIGGVTRVDGVTARRDRPDSLLPKIVSRLDPRRLTFRQLETLSTDGKWFRRAFLLENRLSFQPYSYLGDGVFLIDAIRYTEKIFTSAGTAVLSRTVIPSMGRNVLQSVNRDLIQSAADAYRELQARTAFLGPKFREELQFRFLRDVLLDRFYRRMWKLPQDCLDELAALINDQFRKLNEAARTRLIYHESDIMTYDGVITRREMTTNPLITVAVSEEMSLPYVTDFLANLYDQAEPSFRIVLDRSLEPKVSEFYRQQPNLTFADQYAIREALETASSRFISFVDCDVYYDHWSLYAMMRAMQQDDALDFTGLQLKNVDLYGHAAPGPVMEWAFQNNIRALDLFFAGKMFRTAAIRELPLDMKAFYQHLHHRKMPEPAMISMMSDAELLDVAEEFDPASVKKYRQAHRVSDEKANPFQNLVSEAVTALKKMGSHSPDAEEKTDREDRETPVGYYLNEDIDPSVILIDTEDGDLNWCVLNLLYQLEKPEFDGIRAWFALHGKNRDVSESILCAGFSRTQPVRKDSPEYVRLAFSAGTILSDGSMPDWWIRKHRQNYVCLFYRTYPSRVEDGTRSVLEEHSFAFPTLTDPAPKIDGRTADAAHDMVMAQTLVFEGTEPAARLTRDCDAFRLTPARAIVLDRKESWQTKSETLLRSLFPDRFPEGEYAGSTPLPEGPQEDGAGPEGEVPSVRKEPLQVTPVNDEVPPSLFLILDSLKPGDAVNLLAELYPYTRFNEHVFVSFPEDYMSVHAYETADRKAADQAEAARAERIEAAMSGAEAWSGGTPEEAGSQAEDRAEGSDDETPDDQESPLIRKGADSQAETAPQESAGSQAETAPQKDQAPEEEPAIDAMADTLQLTDTELDRIVHAEMLRGYAEDTLEEYQNNVEIIRKSNIFMTKGLPLNEQIERRRLFGDLPVRQFVLMDTADPERIRSFSRTGDAAALMIQSEAARRITNGDQELIEAIQLMYRCGGGIYTMSREMAEAVGGTLKIKIHILADAGAFFRCFIR